MKNPVKEPEILKSDLDTSATEPQGGAFKAGLEIDELDIEKVTGGATYSCFTIR